MRRRVILGLITGLSVVAAILFVQALPAAAIAVPVSTATVGDPWTKTAADGRVTEWIEVAAPDTVPLQFRYCDAANGTCLGPGTPTDRLDCLANLWIPQFLGAGSLFPQSLTLSAPPGSRADKIFLKAGSGPGYIGADGYADRNDSNDYNSYILGSPPIFGASSVTFQFADAPFNNALHQAIKGFRQLADGTTCGVSGATKDAFVAKFGHSFDNILRQYYKIAIVWSKPTSCCAADQTIDFNGRPHPNRIEWYRPDAAPKPPPLRQAGGNAGTVATAAASALQALGSSATPSAVGRLLASQGIWKPGLGTDWRGLGSYLGSQHVVTTEVPVTTLLDSVGASGKTFLASFNIGQTSQVTLVTNYTASRDTLTLIDPSRGTTSISLEQFLEGNPWIYQLTKPSH